MLYYIEHRLQIFLLTQNEEWLRTLSSLTCKEFKCVRSVFTRIYKIIQGFWSAQQFSKLPLQNQTRAKGGEVTFLIMATFGRRDLWGRFVNVHFMIPQGRCLKEDKKIKSCFLEPLWFLSANGFSSCSSPSVWPLKWPLLLLITGRVREVPYCLLWQNYWHSNYGAVPSEYQNLTHSCPLSAHLTSCGGWNENCGKWKRK